MANRMMIRVERVDRLGSDSYDKAALEASKRKTRLPRPAEDERHKALSKSIPAELVFEGPVQRPQGQQLKVRLSCSGCSA